MEMYKLASVIIALSFASGWMGLMYLMPTTFDNYMENRINESMITQTLNETTGGDDYFEDVYTSATYVASAVGLVFEMIYYTTVGLPQMLTNPPFDFPTYIVATIIVIQVIIVGVGIAAFLRGFVIK